MYCDKCHKQSPENFITCAYCGAVLSPHKKKAPSKFVKKQGGKFRLSLKNLLAVLVSFALLLVVAALFTSLFTATKPERVVKSFVKATQSADADLYYSLYDDNVKKYKLNNRYFAEDETYEQMVLPMRNSNEFYTDKCGEGYKLTYNIKSSSTLTEEQTGAFNEVLESSFSYIESASRVDVISVEIIAKGDEGTYTSQYTDFWCMKIKGKWYKVDKSIYTEYLNTEN